MSASQAIFRTMDAGTGPVNVNEPVPGMPVAGRSRGRWPCCGAGARYRVGWFEAVQQVAVVDGDHDLGLQPARRGQASGGEGRFAGADQAVEEPLRAGPQVQGITGRSVRAALAGAGVGGGVHHGQEGLALVRGREDFDVLQAAAGLAEEHALAAAEFFLGRFRPVLVDPLDPAPGDPGQEIGVVLGCGAGQGVFHPGRGVLGGVVPDPVQGQSDDGRGPGRDGPGRDGGGEFGPLRRLGVTRKPCPGQHRGREAEPAAGFGDADPQPGTEELGRVPAPVISRIRPGGVRRRGHVMTRCGRFGAPSSRPADPRAGDSCARAGDCRTCAGPADPQPADPEPTAAERAATAASRRLRSTAPAATICRYSAAREISSTLSAKSAASRKPNSAASSTAVELKVLSSSRHRASSPDPPSDAASRGCWSPAGTLRRPRPRTAGEG